MAENLQKQITEKIFFHNSATKYYQRINFFCNGSSILLGAIAAIIGTVFNNPVGTVYLFLVVSHWLVTTLNSISQGFKLKTKEHMHFTSLKQYQCLKQEVDLYILESHPDDIKVQQFINEFNDIDLKEPEDPICFGKISETRKICNV